jgi:hypothetical protein
MQAFFAISYCAQKQNKRDTVLYVTWRVAWIVLLLPYLVTITSVELCLLRIMLVNSRPKYMNKKQSSTFIHRDTDTGATTWFGLPERPSIFLIAALFRYVLSLALPPREWGTQGFFPRCKAAEAWYWLLTSTLWIRQLRLHSATRRAQAPVSSCKLKSLFVSTYYDYFCRSFEVFQTVYLFGIRQARFLLLIARCSYE